MAEWDMRYYSTRNKNEEAGFARAALAGLAPDGGLYVPGEIPAFTASVAASLGSMDYRDVAFETIRPYVAGDVPDSALADMVADAYPFDAPLVPVGDRLALELFHGPTAAFKDFGARFMARAFAWLRRGEDRPLRIIAATSGDTGGAVADGFFGVPGVFVTVLYPKGRVSPLQERQIAGLGGNVSALAVEGSFDDCQRLAKEALAARQAGGREDLSSANSINIARLVPQAAYYASAAGKAAAGTHDPDGPATPRAAVMEEKRAKPATGPATVCVPSGNLGNLTAGLYAMRMGAPILRFVAASNSNRTFHDYLESGGYRPRDSVATVSNAMDVGAPSNFERISAHFSLDVLRLLVRGDWISDYDTRETIKRAKERLGYFMDPHTAVGWKALDRLAAEGRAVGGPVVALAAAHPAKFAETVGPLAGPPPVPETLARAMERTPAAKTIPAELPALLAELGE